MTIAPDKATTDQPVPEGHVKLTIDGEEVIAPKGELLIRTAERLGTVVPRFCDHPLLDPAGACRQCLVEVEMGGRPMPKPQASCTMTVADGMVVKTQLTSPVADKAQQGVMELLLINHPLDCPICDKGGECPLQNQAMAHGRPESRFRDTKRTFPKPLPISTQVLLDRERCVLCQRCTRFSAQIAGDPFIDLLERGAHQQIGTSETAAIESASQTSAGTPFQSYFSGNTIQICPVGALTSAQYRFRSRPFDLVSSPSVCEHCSSGCAERTDFRRGKVMRKLAGEDPEVNEEWICDKGRFAFRYSTAADRIRTPLVRNAETGELEEASWTEALRVAAEGLAKARDAAGVGVLTGGRSTVEDAYAYAKFARLALRTNDIDARARAHSAEELDFLGARVAGTSPDNGVTFAAIERAPLVLCVAFEPEEEAPAVFLRLRKAARDHGAKVVHIGQWTSPAVTKTFGELLACVPGGEATAVDGIAYHAPDLDERLRQDGAVLLVGERAAEVPGLFSALHRLSERTGAALAWIPRRAGERGAVEAGALPTLLPGGRPVLDAQARAEVERLWGVEKGSLPSAPGRDTTGILDAVVTRDLDGLLVGGVDPDDLPDPVLARKALRAAEFVVSLELRPSVVTEHADVVLPVAPVDEKSGSFLNWEGRSREFTVTLDGTGALPDCRVLDTLGVEMDVDLFTQTPAAASGDLRKLLGYGGAAAAPDVPDGHARTPGRGEAVLATWRRLIDDGSLLVDEPDLAGTARKVVAKVSKETAATVGDLITVSTGRGSITLPCEVADLPEGVVWLPGNSDGSKVRATLGVGHGAVVTIAAGGAQ
ncbi:NADH-quinone oxidoreductase subunit G [Prauserella marina]|uniref:NADH-quinone oxidoreductase n=1 Tax=Prauserella marina TaxID=530584 RepID=A0A222VJE1_9PSEU|nr:NADH-quinone oxidoreductase subunit G [Prauserella marina]ASR33994.1 NADH-quinone oxidoreductase subunit G [Prauserella marina]PWV82610.1 NADH dehydrogenase subunit G [Prauserella marina]SDC73030.1 NADH-quinone oxidoreductase subunit G [Prauserella marina]